MIFAFDLWSAADVKAHAADILDRLRNGTMCDGAWPRERTDLFARWTESRLPALVRRNSMLILVICHPAEGADPAEFRRLVPAETAALRDLKGGSVLTGAWSPGRPGAVLMLDAPDETEAARLTAGLPLVQAGLISTEIIPLHPMDL